MGRSLDKDVFLFVRLDCALLPKHQLVQDELMSSSFSIGCFFGRETGI